MGDGRTMLSKKLLGVLNSEIWGAGRSGLAVEQKSRCSVLLASWVVENGLDVGQIHRDFFVIHGRGCRVN